MKRQYAPDTGPGNCTARDRTEQACTTELLENQVGKLLCREKGQIEAEELLLCRVTQGRSLHPPERTVMPLMATQNRPCTPGDPYLRRQGSIVFLFSNHWQKAKCRSLGVEGQGHFRGSFPSEFTMWHFQPKVKQLSQCIHNQDNCLSNIKLIKEEYSLQVMKKSNCEIKTFTAE